MKYLNITIMSVLITLIMQKSNSVQQILLYFFLMNVNLFKMYLLLLIFI